MPVTDSQATTVPFVSLERRHAELMPALRDAFERVMASSAFILGEEVARFEEEFAQRCGAGHCVGVGSGTAAIAIAARAAGLVAGDEVIVPAHTFVASAMALQNAELEPVLCDVDPATGLIDPAAAAAAIGPRTAAILAVHLYGQPCDMDALAALAARHSLLVLEDAAQAHGATWRGHATGSLGLAAAFSFYPSKNLGACGDGGAICTDDAQLAGRARMLRDLGRRGEGHVVIGANERLDGLQAAFLRVKLPWLDEDNASRRALAARYDELLAGLVDPLPTRPDAECVYHLYPVRVQDRADVIERLAAAGVDARIHYPLAVHQQPALAQARRGDTLEHAAAWAREELSLPLFPGLTEPEQDAVVAALTEAIG